MLFATKSGPGVVSIEQVNALVPELTERVALQLEGADNIRQLVAELWEARADLEAPTITATAGGGQLVDISSQPSDTPEVRTLKHELSDAITEYAIGWKAIENLGAVVKDPDEGLLDFYGEVDGRLVWFCWQYGEDRVTHYHELDEGFAGRRPLAAVRARSLN